MSFPLPGSKMKNRVQHVYISVSHGASIDVVCLASTGLETTSRERAATTRALRADVRWQDCGGNAARLLRPAEGPTANAAGRFAKSVRLPCFAGPTGTPHPGRVRGWRR